MRALWLVEVATISPLMSFHITRLFWELEGTNAFYNMWFPSYWCVKAALRYQLHDQLTDTNSDYLHCHKIVYENFERSSFFTEIVNI